MHLHTHTQTPLKCTFLRLSIHRLNAGRQLTNMYIMNHMKFDLMKIENNDQIYSKHINPMYLCDVHNTYISF